MKKKMFFNMWILSLISVIFSSALIAGVIYNSFYNSMKSEVRNSASYLVVAMNQRTIDDPYDQILDKVGKENRITLVGQDGQVLYDNEADPATMDNHGERPEIKMAKEVGRGESSRLSDTLGTRTFYYAIRLSDGKILRVANTSNSVFGLLLNCIPYMILVIILVAALGMILANLLIRRIVKPLNTINLEQPLENEVYPELAPLLVRLSRQNDQIAEQIKELREKEEEFDAITSNMQEGLLVLGEKEQVLSVNQSAIQILQAQRPKEEYVGKHILTMTRDLRLEQLIKDAQEGNAADTILSSANREYRVIASPVVMEEKTRGIILLLLDVTERMEGEKMRQEFSANVSHELRTPLTSISGYAEIMKNGMVKEEDIPRFAERIYLEASRLITLVGDIIKLSRLDEEEVSMERETVELLDLSKDICGQLKEEAGKAKVTLEVTGETQSVYGVRRILDEMIVNLVENAIKYNKPGGTVKVLVGSSEKNTPMITVEDTGIGIPPEEQDRIFERFYRVDKSHSKETGGTGLGLSIVKHAAAFHKAKISVTSQLDQGTKITVTF